MELLHHKNGTEVLNPDNINLALTLDCGQAFRWLETEKDVFTGVAYKRQTRVKKTENGILFIDTPEDEVREIWIKYFDLNTDHNEIITRLSGDKHIKSAYEKYGTIHILNQEPWEALCSFIISACNNIPRIKGIIKRLSEKYGDAAGDGFSFPSAKTLATKSEDELSFLRAGYRVPYILDAAKRVAEGETDFDSIRLMTEEEARKELMKIKGVGKKVADCTMLFSLGFTDVYPVDRHIERATREYYPDGLPSFFTPHSGLAQQYIFSSMIDKEK